jgi:ribose transport system permease protein
VKRIAGVLFLLIVMYATLFASNPNAASSSNLIEVANRQGFYGIMTLAAGLMILSGGIDLSLGSVVGLGAILFGTLMKMGTPPLAALVLTVLAGTLIGLVQGLLVNQLRLQSFLVTLCGMFVIRGIARLITGGSEIGLQEVLKPKNHPEFESSLDGLRYFLVGQSADGEIQFPAMLVVFGVIAVIFGAVLHRTVYGRYWYAIGYNEQAARYSGIAVGRYRVATFVLGSSLASFAGCLLLLSYGTAKPDNAGQGYELEAITGAVLGGVSLRGGEGTMIGMSLGAAVLPLLRNLVTFLDIGNEVIPIVVGVTLFVGSFVDELIRRRSASRKG